MPTYQYACTACGHAFEAVQSFSDDALSTCPQCQGNLRKVFSSVGVVFKGSGFYKTDSRSSSTSTAAATSSGSDSGSASSSDSSAADSSGSPSSTASSSGATPAAAAASSSD